MASQLFTTSFVDKTETFSFGVSKRYSRHQITVEKGTTTAGTATIGYAVAGGTQNRTAKDAGGSNAACSFASQNSVEYLLDGAFSTITITAAGTNGTFNVYYTGFDV